MDDHGTDRYRRPGSPVEREAEPILGSDADWRRHGRGRRGLLWILPAVLTLLLGGSWACAEGWNPGVSSPGAGTSQMTPPAAQDLAPELELPVEVNARVDRWIQLFLTDPAQRRTFERFLSRENLYGEIIRRALRERGMPRDLLYVAMIESGFSARALSPREASGLWQFMTPTARDYGLRVTEYVDERRDPVRATEAALSYLEELHARFGSWYLAAAAYNAGPNRVARLVAEHRGGSADEEELFWEIVDRLPAETREYVPKLLAATILAREAASHGFRVGSTDPYRFERVWVPGSTSLERVASALDMPGSRLRSLNPHLIRGETPPGTSYAVRVPPGKAPVVVASLGKRWSLADD